MNLFYAPGSSSLLPHIVLRESALPFVAIKVNEHTKAIDGGGDYRNVNPLGYLPALVLDDGVCFVPIPDELHCSNECRLFDYLVGLGGETWRHFDAHYPCRFQIDHKFKFGWFYHWQIGRLGPF